VVKNSIDKDDERYKVAMLQIYDSYIFIASM